MKARDGWLYRPVWLVLVGAAVCGADTQYYAAYDMFVGDVISTARWSFYAYYTYFRNMQASAGGTLPAGLIYITEHHGAPEVEAWTGYFRGTVTATPSLPETYHHTVLLHYEQWEWSNPPEQQWDNVTDTYHTRLRVDEHANTPGDTAHLSTLPVQTAWSENSGWVNGHLYPGEQFGEQLLPADVDVFRVDTGKGVYCVETEANLDLTAPALQIEVYKKAAGDDAYDGEWIARTNDYNLFDDNGNVHRRRQRVYFTLDNNNGTYVRITPGESINPRTYKLRIFRTRPVILVHGINAPPTEAGPNQPEDPNTSFGDMRDYLGYFANIHPCVCYDFPWWSNHPSSRGFKYYVGTDRENKTTLYGYLYDKVVNVHKDFPANVILHSMGGFVVRFSLANPLFANKVNRVIFINSPQYGSDLANFLDRRPGANEIVNAIPFIGLILVMLTCGICAAEATLFGKWPISP